MSQGRKYAALPDLDSAPDTYETREPAPLSTTRSSTPNTPTEVSDDEASSHIDRAQLHPDNARDRFRPSRIDARDVDFSDRVDGRKRSYRVSSKRRNGVYTSAPEDDAQDETLDERIARLKREVEEVRVEAEKNQKEEDGKTDAVEGVAQLSALLRDLQVTRSARVTTSTQAYANITKPDHLASTTTAPAAISALTRESLASLTKATTLESRLASLESALGISALSLPSHTTFPRPNTNRSIVQILDNMERQVSALAGTTLPTLEGMDQQIRKLTQDAEKLTLARQNAARAAIDASGAREKAASSRPVSMSSRPGTSSAGGIGGTTGAGNATADRLLEDAEQIAKIDALYATLGTIETLAPLLPSVVDRLRTLRTLHTNAATAEDDLGDLEKKQAQMGQELSRWREGLEKVEEAIVKGEGKEKSNVKVVEQWIADLEQRVGKIE